VVGGVFLAYQIMCDGCPYRDLEPAFTKLKYCNVCKKKEELDNMYKVLKYR